MNKVVTLTFLLITKPCLGFSFVVPGCTFVKASGPWSEGQCEAIELKDGVNLFECKEFCEKNERCNALNWIRRFDGHGGHCEILDCPIPYPKPEGELGQGWKCDRENENDCGWQEWTLFSSCTKTCGGGTKSRTRERLFPAAANGANCKGAWIDLKSCNTNSCDCPTSNFQQTPRPWAPGQCPLLSQSVSTLENCLEKCCATGPLCTALNFVNYNKTEYGNTLPAEVQAARLGRCFLLQCDVPQPQPEGKLGHGYINNNNI